MSAEYLHLAWSRSKVQNDEVDLELQRKIYSVQSEELNQLRQEENKALTGKMDKAMNQVLSEAKSK